MHPHASTCLVDDAHRHALSCQCRGLARFQRRDCELMRKRQSR
jgi:hypothetical protein